MSTIALSDKCCCYIHFRDEEIEAQRGSAACLRLYLSQSWNSNLCSQLSVCVMH